MNAGLVLLLSVSASLIIYILRNPRKAREASKKISMNCELCIRSIGDDVYRIEASWCDTKAKAVGTMQISNPKDISLGDIVAFIEASRVLAEARGDITNED
jgi:hypothetical protein